MNHSERWMELARGTCTLRKMTQMESRRANPECLNEGLIVVREMESVHMALARGERLFPFPAVQPADPLVSNLVRVLKRH